MISVSCSNDYAGAMAAKRKTMTLRKPVEILETKPKKAVPFPFVLDELDDLDLHTNPMFGCLAVYVGEKIMFALRNKGNPKKDDGVWIATTQEHHASLQKTFPNMRSISVLGDGAVTGWQNLPADEDDFEESVLRACTMIRKCDPRIGKVPKAKKRKKKALGA